MAAPPTADRLRGEIDGLARRGLPREGFLRAAGERLRRAFSAAAVCWATLDPDTLLVTSIDDADLVEREVVPPEAAGGAGAAVVRGEYLVEDATPLAALARARRPVGVHSRAAGRRPERSARYRGLMRPHGIPFEMRAALRSRGRALGAVVLHRRAAAGDFTAREADLLAALSAPLAEGLRAGLRADAAARGGPGAPGLVVLGPSDEVEMVSPAAAELLGMPADGSGRPPVALVAAAAAERSRGGGATAVTVRGREGLVTLHASRPAGPADARVAVVVEPARPDAVAAVRMEACGLTPREREVVALVARGRSTAEMAGDLTVSPHTVQDHLKSVFDKTGARSRRQLVARIALDDHLPLIVAGAPLDASGRLPAST